MSPVAKVTSIDALPLLAAALQKFRSEGAGAVDDVASEVRRALEWIHHERKDFWTTELHRAEDSLNQARVQLAKAMTMRRVADNTPACIDEKRALERAKRRVETARRKLEAVRHWSVTLDRAADDFRRSHLQFATWIDVDVSRAAAALNDMSESLVAYISLKTSEEAPKAAEKPTEATTTGATTGEAGAPANEEKAAE